MTSNLTHAQRIGSEYACPSLTYCADDNTYDEKPGARIAWACPLSARPVANADPLLDGDLFTLMFG